MEILNNLDKTCFLLEKLPFVKENGIKYRGGKIFIIFGTNSDIDKKDIEEVLKLLKTIYEEKYKFNYYITIYEFDNNNYELALCIYPEVVK